MLRQLRTIRGRLTLKGKYEFLNIFGGPFKQIKYGPSQLRPISIQEPKASQYLVQWRTGGEARSAGDLQSHRFFLQIWITLQCHIHNSDILTRLHLR